jgi:uncharacterized protein (TIGR00369 family)
MIPDPAITARVQQIFSDAAFLDLLGIVLDGAGHGWCRTSLTVDGRLLQQHGFVHAGVITTLADHTCGGAARSSLGDDRDVITIEFKINFLKPAMAERLEAHGAALRAGPSIVVAESEVFAVEGARRDLVSKCISTLAVIPQSLIPDP